MKTSKQRLIAAGKFVFILVIPAILVFLTKPVILKSSKKVDKVQAISNMKNIHLIMMAFEHDFGSFPDAHTAKMKPSLHAFTGNYSNQFLGQLIAGGYTESEEIFYAKGGNPSDNRKPDNVIEPSHEILRAGECGMGYVLVTGSSDKMKGLRGLSTSDNGGIPYLCSPLSGGGNDAVFRREIHRDRGVYLRIDGSAKDGNLDENKRIKLQGENVTLFQLGEDTVWGSGENALIPTVLMPQ